MQRYFAISKTNDNLILSSLDIHHIKHVMRGKVGEVIEVIYLDTLYLCSIKNLDEFSLNIISENVFENTDNISVVLAVGMVKEQKMDLILQKATELGASRIIPVSMERSIVKLDKERFQKKLVRWNLICKEASEQSHRMNIPIIDNITSIRELSRLSFDLKLVCTLSADSISLKKSLQENAFKSILIVIGPEGGISDKETLELSRSGFIITSLGNNVLRVETAVISALSNIFYELN